MQRKLNLKLIGITLGSLFVVAVLVHFLHQYQLRQNAYGLLQHADRALQADDLDKAESYYAQYLEFVPDDADTMQKYAEVLDRRGADSDRIQLIVKMEQVLRVKPNERAFRLRLVENLIQLDHIPEAMEHLKKLLGPGDNQAELRHILGWCQEAKKEYTQAAESFRAAIKLNPQQIKSYVLLTEVLQDRLNQPEEALKVMEDLVKANASSFQAYLLRARFHRRRGEEKAAESALQTALKLGPHQPDVILEAAEAARTKNRMNEAVRLLEDGSKRYPDNPDFYKALAHLKIQTEKRGEAIAHLQEGLRHAPKSYDLAILMIDLMIDRKQYADAGKKIQDLHDAGLPPTLPNYLTARLCVAEKQWQEAIKLLEGVREKLGAHSEWTSRVHLLLGLCYRQAGNHEQELLAFRRAVNDEPGWMLANLGLGSALLSNGQVEEAVNLLEPLRTTKDVPASYWLLLAKALLERQRRAADAPAAWEKIEQALAKAETEQPDGVEVPILRAELLAAQKNYTAAESLLQKTQAAHPDEISVWCARADLAVRQEHWEEAEIILEQTSVQPDFRDRLEWRLAKVSLWGRHGTLADLDKLARFSDEVAKAGPGKQRIRLRRELAETWYRLGNWQRAEQFWRALAQELPKDLPSRTSLLELALDKNQAKTAEQWRDEIRKIEGSGGALARYGAAAILVQEAHGRRSNLQEARGILSTLKQQDWPRVALLSATIFEMEGQYQNAIRDYERALELGGMQPRSMVRLLELLLERREYSKAEAELAKYEQKLPLTKDLARLGAEIAAGMRDKGYARVALKRAEAALMLPTRDYRELLWLARICQAAGENARAEKLLRDSVQIAGHTPDTWIALVEFLVQTNRRAEAIKEVERLKQELPQDRQTLTLARCYEAMHRPDDADRAYQAGLKERPDDFALLAFAADFYRRADRAAEARKLYERLLTPALATPAEFTVTARRQLAILLAQRGDAEASKQALALLDANRRRRGATVADERIRLFIQGQKLSERNSSLNKFQESLARQQPTAEERLLLAQMLEATDNLGQASSLLSEVVEQHPTAPLYLSRFARVLIKTGELDEAQSQIARLATLEPGSQRVRDLQAALARAKQKAGERGASAP